MEQNEPQKWLLCVDPDSKQIYAVNTLTNEIKVYFDVPQGFRQKADEAIDSIEKVTMLKTGNWIIQGKEIDAYRRRPIPSYFLQKQSSQVPIYLAQSTLSQAFSEIHSLHLVVNLERYSEQLPFAYRTVEIDAALVTSADEVLKIILKKVIEETLINLKVKDNNNQFVMQVSGLREFLTGSYPLLQFERIRLSLRGMKTLELQLSEVPRVNKVNEQFPPIIVGSPDSIDWDNYIDLPVLLWYAPFKLPQIEQPKNLEQDRMMQSVQNPRLISNPFFMSNQFKKEVDLARKSIQEVSMPQFKDQNDLDKKIKQLQDAHFQKSRRKTIESREVLYSGQCDSWFKINIEGIDRLIQILEHDFQGLKKKRATYNGIMPLQFITKTNAKPQQQHNVSKKSERSSSLGDKPKETKPIPLKFTNRQSDTNQELLQGIGQLKYVAFGGVEYKQFMRILQERYDLDFIPYLLAVRVSLYNGARLLTDWCTLETRSVPFSMQPRFNEQIFFKGIKISLLPLETRLCFNIVAYSYTGTKQILASAQMYLFDEQNLFRQGKQFLNVWPFCRNDPRLLCMGQYNGIVAQQRPKEDNLNQFIQGHFCKLIIQLDQFSYPLKHSIRDRKQMQGMGFPNNVKSTQFYSMKLHHDQELLKQIKKSYKNQQIQNEDETYMPIQSKSTGSNSIYSIVQQQQQQDSLEQLKANKKKFQTYLSKEEIYGQLYPFKNWDDTPSSEELAYIQTLLNMSPIDRHTFSKYDRYIIIKCRNHLRALPQALQIFLLAVDYSDPDQVRESHKMLKEWVAVNHENALPLLDAHYPDALGRLIAVERLSELHDDELQLYMLELTQAIMFEKNLLNPLGEMLIERSLANPWVVGHELFWLLRSQLHVKPSYERFALLLEQLLMLCGDFRKQLIQETLVNDEINKIAEGVKELQSNERLIYIQKQLTSSQSKFPDLFTLALDARLQASQFDVQKCNILDSKKLPLWLVAITSESQPPIKIIFKNGDDMRQDLLTLQLIRIMDKIWLDSGLDFRMKPYKVIATSDQVGMIEVVQQSQTISKIHQDAGHLGAFNEKSILHFLKQYNTTDTQMEDAIENFLRSCAGYCVCTYILGIGDRHSGNIMISETGHLFHIDFGHFLGNFKSKFGFKRERTPFVLTMEMAHVMGGQNTQTSQFQRFEEYCTQAYNMVRKHGTFLINIFLMNLSAGMPELQIANDVRYLQDQLALNISDQEATALFRTQIKNSLSDQWRQIDNFIHNLKRKG